MIILDTNILAALMHEQTDVQLMSWLEQQSRDALWISSITLFEIRSQLAMLVPGANKDLMQRRFELTVQNDLNKRIVPFDLEAGNYAANLAAQQHRQGQNLDMRDLFIAGIVQAKRATLATRDTSRFVDYNIPLINPWLLA